MTEVDMDSQIDTYVCISEDPGKTCTKKEAPEGSDGLIGQSVS